MPIRLTMGRTLSPITLEGIGKSDNPVPTWLSRVIQNVRHCSFVTFGTGSIVFMFSTLFSAPPLAHTDEIKMLIILLIKRYWRVGVLTAPLWCFFFFLMLGKVANCKEDHLRSVTNEMHIPLCICFCISKQKLYLKKWNGHCESHPYVDPFEIRGGKDRLWDSDETVKQKLAFEYSQEAKANNF